MRAARPLLLGICLAGAAGLGGARQDPGLRSQDTFRTGVEVVQLDVTVLDRHRQPIRGLSAADFTVLEDGRPRPIAGVTAIDVPPSPAPPAGWMRDVSPDVVTNALDPQRLVVIVFDDANSGVNYGPATGGRDPWHEFYDPSVNVHAQRIAYDIVDRLGPGDLAAVVFTQRGRSQNFTANRSLLLRAIDSFVGKNAGAPPQSRELAAFGSTGGPSLACSFRGRNCVIDTLERVAGALPEMPPRRKVIVLISQGFRIPALRGERFDPAGLGPDVSDLSRLFRDLQQANVAVYAFDPGGLQVGKEQFERAQLLQTFAEQTGGRALSQTNAPWEGVPQLFEETGSYYLVGFEPSARDGRFRSVTVRVNRPDVQVRTRSGYFAPDARAADDRPAAARSTAASPAEAALESALPGGDLGLASSIAALGVPGQRDASVLLTSVLQLSASDLDPAAPLELIATAYDENWKPRGTATQTAAVTLPTAAATAVPVTLFSTLHLRPGRYEVRIAAASGGATGHLYADIDVPDIARAAIALSDAIVGALPDAGQPTPFEGVPLLPTARRTFASSDRPVVFLRVSAARPPQSPAAAVDVQIDDGTGRRVFGQRDNVPLARAGGAVAAADYRFEIPVAALSPGPHLLTFTAALGDRHATRQLRFDVR